MTIKRVGFIPAQEEIKEEKMEQKSGTPITPEDIKKLNPEIVDRPPAIVGEDKVLGLTKFRTDMQEAGRVVLPYLKLVQAMSDDFTNDGVPPGHYRNSLSGEDYGDNVEVYPISVLHWRRFFDQRVVMCASNDALTGYGDPGGECKICPLQKWHVIRANREEEVIQNARTFRAKKDEEMIPPLCSEQFVFPCMILSSEWGIPGALVFHKSYLQEGLRFYSMIEFAPEDTVYRLSAFKSTNDKGTWWQPKVAISRKMTETEKQMALKYRRNMSAVVDVEIEEDGEQA